MSDTNKLAMQWRSVSHLLDEALLLPASERERWLAELPVEQIHLRETLRHFLELHARIDGEGFLASPAQPPIDMVSVTPLLSPGASVGPYRVIEELGAGGMGSVWLAERSDKKPRRRVALKLPRMVWASDLSARLERERDILASLEHPNIARLYDAGLDDQARPYLAIEYVEGIRITQYCREHQLSPRQRVELFMQVLAAVQYAHTRLVLHRDLKPSNILVNRNGDVRLLDFGIAKLIEDSQADSEADPITVTRALTPRYASPEQLRGERLTLVSDVYSLGVILYELLAELSPYPVSAKSRVELELAVMEGVLTPPSRRVASSGGTGDLQLSGLRLSRVLRGDLDAIVLKSLALDVHCRYASVEALAKDLQRWLDGRPVLASAPSKWVIAQKFALRNRAAVSIATAATIMILATSGVAIYQAKKATAESQRAAATRDFLIDMFEGANPELHGGREATVRELVSTAETALYSSLYQQPLVQAEMLGSLVNVWLRLGDRKRAGLVLDKKIQALSSAGEQAALASSTIDKISLSLHLGEIETANRLLVALKDRRLSSNLDQVDQVTMLWQEGWVQLQNANPDDAIRCFLKAEVMAKDIGNNASLASALYGKAMAYKAKSEWSSAVSALREARKVFSIDIVSNEVAFVGAIELLSAHLALGLYKEGWEFLNGDLNKTNVSSVITNEITTSYELALALRLRLFQYVLDKIKNDEIYSESVPDVKLILSSILIESGNFDAAKKALSSMEEKITEEDRELDAQINLREIRIALIEGDLFQAESLSGALEEFVKLEGVDLELLARARSSLAMLRFIQLKDDQANRHLLESAEFYKKKYGSRHPKYLEMVLAASLIGKSGEPYKNGLAESDVSLTVLLEVLKQAYPVDHPIVVFAERFAVESGSPTQSRISGMSRESLFKDLLLLS